jgi:hypothetical protein
MDIDQQLYTVEFIDPFCSVVYYREILATDIGAAKNQIMNRHPDAIIRAVTLVQLIEEEHPASRIIASE